MVAGSELLIILDGAYTVRIELIQGSQTRLDYISYEELPGSGITPDRVERSTWSRIKGFYR